MKKIFLTLLSTVWVLSGNASTPGSSISEERSGSLSISSESPGSSISSRFSTSTPSYIQYMQNLAKEAGEDFAQLENENEIAEQIEDIVKLTIEKAKDKNAKAKEIADQGLYPWFKNLLYKKMNLERQMRNINRQLYDKQKELENKQGRLLNKETSVEKRSLTLRKPKEIEKLEKEAKELKKLFIYMTKKVSEVDKKVFKIRNKGLDQIRKHYSYVDWDAENFESKIKILGMDPSRPNLNPLIQMNMLMLSKLENQNASTKTNSRDALLSPNQNANPYVPSYLVPNQSANSYVPSYSSPNQSTRTNPYESASSNSGISRR